MSQSRTRVGRRWVALAAALFLVGGVALPAYADETAFTITDERITESSGLAADVANNVVWTVNDDAPGRVFALDEKGKVAAVIDFSAEITDVEGVARAGDRLYVGDIGDNKAKREFVTVFSILNPKPVTAKVRYRAWDFVYPDGKAHNAEALLVNDAGKVFIVTKEAKAAIYAFEGTPSPQGTNQLTKVAKAPSFVTDGTFLPDGRMVLRTYVGVYVLDADYSTIATAALPYQPQGESITTSLTDTMALWVGSEGKSSTVLSVPIPTEKAPAPKASKKPPPKAESSPTATAAESAEDRSATPWILLIAAVVAVLAAVATALIGRPAAGARGAKPQNGSGGEKTVKGGGAALRHVGDEAGRHTWAEEDSDSEVGEPVTDEKPGDAAVEASDQTEGDRSQGLGWLYPEGEDRRK